MSVHILCDTTAPTDRACLYCSTTDVAFGPVFYGSDEGGRDAVDRAEAFLRFLPQNARLYSDAELLDQYAAWRDQEGAQWQREEAADAARFDFDD